ncbi:cation:proton antiporter [Deinococcus roseus]|uniref:K(+)/H(+) antiporter YhaU n=1 Tax=Deinococcus roseus TaxID=392414 RepID=A0ABQ2CX02_9DEIO|nr:cation:proton antiporter [Deinococcus roseus]GGJ29059.1 K(+)/H(+) antiporter YhaU [Deinococcus roseus]
MPYAEGLKHFVESLGALGELGLIGLGLWISGLIAQSLRLPALLGYIGLGFLCGPLGPLPIIYPSEITAALSEIGVVLLMFFIGLEFSLKRFLEARGTIMKAGLWDLLNLPVGFGAGLLLGFSFWQCIFLAGITYVSSSGVIIRMLTERQQVAFPEAERTLGVLIFEDLAMILYLGTLSVFTGGNVWQKLLGVVTFGVMYLVMLRFGRPMLEKVMAQQSKEQLVLLTLGGVAMFAALAHLLSFPDAVAAFLLGALVGELSRMHEIEEVLTPWRDVAVGAFFLGFGLKVEAMALLGSLLVALLLLLLTLVSKSITGFFAGRATGLSLRASVGHGLMLLPRGEFSLVIAGLAVSSPLLSQVQKNALYELTSAYVLLSILLGVVVSARHIPLTRWFAESRWLKRFDTP